MYAALNSRKMHTRTHDCQRNPLNLVATFRFYEKAVMRRIVVTIS